jgi:Tfp pilus assembly PilM family ATPase
MVNIDKFFASELNVPVEILDPFEISKDNRASTPSAEVKPIMAVAMGLGLRKMWDWQK